MHDGCIKKMTETRRPVGFLGTMAVLGMLPST